MGKLVKGVTGALGGFATGGWAGAAAGALGGLTSGGGGKGGGGQSPQAAGFTPYSIKSGIATSTVDPTARTASYTLTPEMQAFRDQYFAGATAALPSAEQTAYAQQVSDYGKGLFGRATAMDTGAMTQDYFNKNLALLEPARAQESSRLNDLQFARGTTGAGIGMGAGYVNPQQFALASAREQQNAALALSAEDRARAIQGEELQRAGALYGLGQTYLTQPYETANTLLGYGINLENLGANTMAQGLNTGISVGQLGNQTAAYNADINQQNYLNNLYKQRANNAALQSGISAIGNVNWSGLFGGLPSTEGVQAYQLGQSSYVDPATYGGQRMAGVFY
jgi:hypothetical protein